MRSCRPKRNFLVSSQAMSLRLVALWACAYTVKAGFFCKAAWCSDGSVCCKNDAYGLCDSPGGIINLCAPGSHCNQQTGNCYVGETEPEEEDEVDLGFYCKAAWCSEGSVCCSNDAYGLCGSPGTTCCFSPNGGIINLCAPGSHCNQETGNCYA